jgi:SAM-dependent methyltransferase
MSETTREPAPPGPASPATTTADQRVPGHAHAARPGAGNATVDWQAWVDGWDSQQAGYVAERERRLSFAFDVVERLGAAPGTLLDLAAGPGTVSARALRRFPGARVLAVDADPFLMELGRRTLGDRVRWIRADLREDSWAAQIADAELDAVCSTTALHWLGPDETRLLAAVLAAKLRPGGVFVNYDSLPLSAEQNPRLAALATDLRHERARERQARGAQDWESWWASARREPAFAGLIAERDRIFSGGGTPSRVELQEMVEALRVAGFTEVDTLAQEAERRLLVAIR